MKGLKFSPEADMILALVFALVTALWFGVWQGSVAAGAWMLALVLTAVVVGLMGR